MALTERKAAKILKHGKVKGRRITPSQRSLFLAVAHEFKPTGKGGK